MSVFAIFVVLSSTTQAEFFNLILNLQLFFGDTKNVQIFLTKSQGNETRRVRYSVACLTSNTISQGLNEYFKIKKLNLFAFSRNACFHQRSLKQFWLKRNHSQVDRVDTSSSALSLKSKFLLYEKSFIRCKMQILLLVFGMVETSCLKA